MSLPDTIAAISSATGPSARMIVRVSGPLAPFIITELSDGQRPAAGAAFRCELRLGKLAFPAWIYAFTAPRSYTGEDLAEFHLPGNPLLARLVLDGALRLGARPAEAGEFTARAYSHGRMDLAEAEGVAAAISAQNDRQLRAARQLMAGELARRLRPPMNLIAETLALVEVGIDFSEEDVSFLSRSELANRLTDADAQLAEITSQSTRFERLMHEPHIVMIGRPNAGKSTLLNALAEIDRAVVSPVAGTTRDVIWAEVPLARGFVRLVDAAGLENDPDNRLSTAAATSETNSSMPLIHKNAAGAFAGSPLVSPPYSSPHPRADAHPLRAAAAASMTSTPMANIEIQMREHAMRELERADLVLLVEDPAGSSFRSPRKPDLVIHTKSDLRPATLAGPDAGATGTINISAHTGHNLDILRDRLDELAFGNAPAGDLLALNARHQTHIAEARSALERTRLAFDVGAEIIALELRECLDSLGSILGNISPDDLLGRIFSAFCIGK